jgi:hypothetical protein
MINTSLTKGLMCLLAKLFPSCSAPELTKFVSKIISFFLWGLNTIEMFL